ncbi:MAG: hypothetical protein M1376_01470 [Planctomycetes bacterium]|nr:hypothetical protein [Planctomycetota bacterium]
MLAINHLFLRFAGRDHLRIHSGTLKPNRPKDKVEMADEIAARQSPAVRPETAVSMLKTGIHGSEL